MRTIAVYGAGPALGMAVARRFGREGFRVALVARDRERLDGMVRDLAGEGVEAGAFRADLADPAAALRVTGEIEDRFGAIDVLEHSPVGPGVATRPLDLDAAAMDPLLDLYLRGPLALVRRVLPGMRERGGGGLLFAMGASAAYPSPRWAGAGVALSGLRNYVHTLHAELDGSGVYAGALLIGALIEGSRAHRESSGRGGAAWPVVTGADLADRLWDMYAARDRVEDVVVPGRDGAGAPA
ncbi:SDR family oxidoreductase [Streptomyces sp. HPF1205]|uniref:SDR family NAD(P)-dependent oxidoreductase n=1 Tax=Streptomyces sp. HPF1205 TaxID=2873262 RepID=UPI001CECB181|nr:SDR family NAD(P)-dependent oxidoreductase [Streptomyces sp. HPF1205]